MKTRNLVSSLTVAASVVALQTGAFAQVTEALPVCANNGPYVNECLGQLTSVPVTSTGSFDPDGSPITVFWFEECDYAFFDDATNVAPNFVLDMELECSRTCVFALRVFSGGQMSACQSTATVQDTTAPVISTLVDIVDIWGIPIDVGSTGIPTAVDACDPAPVVQMVGDVHSGPFGPGHEDTITRTWIATDNCGFTAQTVQTITLLSPLGGAANLEIDTNQCDDVFDRADASSTLDITLLGRVGMSVTGVQRNTLKLSRLGDQTNFVWATNPYQFAPKDIAISAAAHIGDCNPPGIDGRKDLVLRFDRQTVRNVLGLDSLPQGATVYVALTGLRNNNTPFIAGAKLSVH